MARRSKEDTQDIAIHHMDKLNRRNLTEIKQKTLAEQIEEADLPEAEKIRRMTQYNWNKSLQEAVLSDRNLAVKLSEWCRTKFKGQFETFRKEGTSFREIVMFIKSKEEEYLNH